MNNHLLTEFINKTQTDGIIVITKENDAEVIKIKKNITVDLKYNKVHKYFTDVSHNVYLPLRQTLPPAAAAAAADADAKT